MLDVFKKSFLPYLAEDVEELAFASFVGSSDAFALLTLAEKTNRLVLAVTAGIPEASRLSYDLQILSKFSPQTRLFEFPATVEDDATVVSRRLKTLSALSAYSISPYPAVIVAPSIALGDLGNIDLAEIPQSTVLNVGAGISLGELAEKLRTNGYLRTPETGGIGEYSIRGGIVDFWSPDSPVAVRVEFFGDEIESIREFDPGTQLSTNTVSSAGFAPCSIPSETGNPSKRRATIFDLLPAGSSVFFLEYPDIAGGENPPDFKPDKFNVFYSGEPAPQGVALSDFRTAPLPGFANLGLEKVRYSQILEERRAALKRHLANAKIKGKPVVEDLDVSGGFETDSLVVVAKSDRILSSFKSRSRRILQQRSYSGERLSADSIIEPGEKVVHIEHGIGKFLGTTEIETSRGRAEMFAIEYAGGSKLYVPVTSAHLLSRYVGVRGVEAKLDELDSKKWRKTKENAEKSVRDLAASLLEVQAKRAAVPGFASKIDFPEIASFEESFPYEETPDQLTAIAAVKADMAASRPMDRLVCGDAGYGKTEVAMRAAFIAAINGRQTALLAPTTVLAEQHLETFLERFDGTGVAIEALSRFQPPESRRTTMERLAAGTVDIVIGTHAILSEKIAFKNLGLIIIDEEQRFGVRHKEHLKKLRTEADVLTLSATPIPRTLYLSMTGARDLSQLRTAPRERTAVETIIRRDTDETIREALERELARGGQAFYLYNRVRGIKDVAKRVKSLFPKATVSIAHAQMPTDELAARMADFAQGKIQILVCTTIIESGLDIPRANTIIVDRADRFGLAELYQIRGRVGRSVRQGYAYLLLPGEGLVDSEARERLAALKRHSGLGAGFDIALRDLELRGAGNLLGREQSGHIAAVGFQLYCQLLRRAVDKLKGGKIHEVVEVSLNLDFIDLGPGTVNEDAGACLPYEYIEEESQRLPIYRRLAECSSVWEVRRLAAELRDRFGPMPKTVKRLLKLGELRISAGARKISRIDVINSKATFYKSGETTPWKIAPLPSTTADAGIAGLFRLITQH